MKYLQFFFKIEKLKLLTVNFLLICAGLSSTFVEVFVIVLVIFITLSEGQASMESTCNFLVLLKRLPFFELCTKNLTYHNNNSATGNQKYDKKK